MIIDIKLRAVHFLRNLTENQYQSDLKDSGAVQPPHVEVTEPSGIRRVRSRLRTDSVALLNDAASKIFGGMSSSHPSPSQESSRPFNHLDPQPVNDIVVDPSAGISDDQYSTKSLHAMIFILPQITLKSEIDDRSVAIVTAHSALIQSFSILDDTCLDDSINAVCMNRSDQDASSRSEIDLM